MIETNVALPYRPKDLIGPLYVKKWAVIFKCGRTTASKRLNRLLQQEAAKNDGERTWYVARSELTDAEAGYADRELAKHKITPA